MKAQFAIGTLVLSSALLVLAFTNCSKTNFANSSASTGDERIMPAACNGLLCGISMDDIEKISLKSEVNATSSNRSSMLIETTVDSTSQTLSSDLLVTASTTFTGQVTLANCSSSGDASAYEALKENLGAVTFTSAPGTSAALADLASVKLTVKLKNGTEQNYNVNAGTQSVAVTGLASVNAIDLVKQLRGLVTSASCELP